MFRNDSASTSHFAMIPKPSIPRSVMNIEQTHKTTFDGGYLVPMFIDEVLPGDHIKLRHSLFARMATPIFPVMDNAYMDTFYFFVPNRLVWTNWVRFMGEQDNPADSISYTVPQQVSPVGGYAINSLQDYIGLPTAGMLGANTKSHNALPLRAYNLIYNDWFRDENLQNSSVLDLGNGPDASPSTNYVLLRRGKRHDYFTSCLPWPQKGATGVTIPLAGTAPVKGIGMVGTAGGAFNAGVSARETTPLSSPRTYAFGYLTASTPGVQIETDTNVAASAKPLIYADLSASSGVLINQLRQSIMIQELLEIDARGGTRYTEIVRAHFGVLSPDARQQRPEYLGGGSVPVNINPIAQTSATGLTGGTTPQGTLSAMATTADTKNGFNYAATEHGYILGLVCIRADLTYQRGIDRHWTRSTRYDFYFPAFAHLGEKAVRNDEIYCDGSANDILTFGYQEAWAEYRFMNNRISGLFKSSSAGTIDPWHFAQVFASLPTLGTTFIQDTPPFSRVQAVASAGKQFIFDSLFKITKARVMPMYSVPHISSHL